MSSEGVPEKTDGNHSDSLVNNDGFYRLILDAIIQDKKLRLPKKFVKKYGNELAALVSLHLKDGRIWFVRLQRADQKLWFCDGWHEFLEDSCVTAGNFLIFRYEGNSSFNVYIYRLEQCEMNYSSSLVGNDNQKNPLGNSEQLNPGKQYSVACTSYQKADNTTAVPGFQYSCPSLSSFNYKTLEGSCSRVDFRPSRGYILNSKELDANPVQENRQCTQNIGTQTGPSEPKDTKERPGLTPHESMGTRRKRKRTAKLSQLVEHMSSIKEEEAGLKVLGEAIPSKLITRRSRLVTGAERERAFHAAKMFNPANPFFRVILRPSYVYKGFLLHIPRSFVRKHLSGVSGFISLQVSKGRLWPVRCLNNGNGDAKLCRGWTEFVWENNLEEGDVCVFELIRTDEIVLKVAVFRAIDDGDQKSGFQD